MVAQWLWLRRELSQQLGDDKSLSEHLKLPVQRINDYQLLLRELVKYSSRLGEDTTDLGKALELMLAVPHRANDNKFINNIEGYHGNIHKLGRLLRHDWFCVTDRDGKSKERYLFLFKARILICKVRRISEDRSVFVLKDIIRLPEVEVKDHRDNPRVFELHHKQSDFGNFPLTISAHKDRIKDSWLAEIRQFATDILALAEHAADDLRLQPSVDENKRLSPLQGIHIEPATPDQVIPLEPRDTKPQKQLFPKRCSPEKKTKEEPVLEKQDKVKEPTVGEKRKETDHEVPADKKIKEEKVEEKKVKDPQAGEKRKDIDLELPIDKKIREEKQEKVNETSAAVRQVEVDLKQSVDNKVIEEKVEKRQEQVKESSVEDKQKEVYIKVKKEKEEDKQEKKEPPIENKQKEVYITVEEEKGDKQVKKESSVSITQKKEDSQLVSENKVKVEEAEMDPYGSFNSRRSTKRVEEFRSVSSSMTQEVYIESSTTRSQTSSGRSSSRSMKVIEESASVNGRTVASSREVIGGGSGYSAIQEVSSGGVTIEEISSKQGGSTRSIQDRRRSSSGKPVFTKTIEAMSVQREQEDQSETSGGNAVFECELEEKAKVMWLKDNKPLEDKLADRIRAVTKDETKHRLEIKGAHENDSGAYTARAEGASGVSLCTAHLLVADTTEQQRRGNESKEPYFLISLHDTELLESTYLRFLIKVRGDPKPDVKFYKNDRLITVANERVEVVKTNAERGFYELIIPDVQQEDAGNYKCIASNIHGEAECESNVTVVDDKKLFEGLENAELLKPGEQPNFTWLRDGKPFDPEDRFKVLFQDDEDSLALVFQHVKPEDAGLYTCVASTTTGKISCSAELTVQGAVNQLLREPQKPKLVTEVKKQESTVGGTAVLELKVEGYPKPEVKWTHEGTEITAGGKYKFLHDEEESMSLVIKNIQSEDAGDYKIKAINDLGEDVETVHLTVKAPPKFKSKLTDCSCMAEAEIKLRVQVEGCPQPDVTWYKDGKVILKSNERVKTFNEEDFTYELVIERATLDDSGSYSVVASNELSQSSEFCKVDVHSPPEFVKTMAKRVETNENDTVTFQVKVRGDPMPTVRWLKNGSQLKSDGGHIQISEDGATHTLVVHGINRKDTAKYTCEISNKYGTAKDESEMFVRCCPQFRTKLTDQKANEGDTNVEFTVNIEAFPKPQVRWFHNEIEITEKLTEFTKIEENDGFYHNCKLVIEKVTTEMCGKYSCKVSNEYGKEETSCKFTVYSKPRFSKPLPKDVKVDEGASLTLQIEVEGTPDPSVKWYKNGQEVSGDAHVKISRDTKRVENYNLTFTLVKIEDGGEYEVRATNEMGSAVTKTSVLVQTKSSVTEQQGHVADESSETKTAQQAEASPQPEEITKAEPEPSKKQKTEDVTAPKPEAAQVATPEESAEVLEEPKTAEIDKVEAPSRGKRDKVEPPPKECATVEQEDKPKMVEKEGVRQAQGVSIEDIGDEERDTFDHGITKVGSFSCVEVKFDQVNVEDLPNNSSGVIEEFSESDDKGFRLDISRNVSIVSMSDDESFRQTPLPFDTPEPTKGRLFNFERKDSFEIDIKKASAAEVADYPLECDFSAEQEQNNVFDEPENPQKTVIENGITVESDKARNTEVEDMVSKRKSMFAKKLSIEEVEDVKVEPSSEIKIENSKSRKMSGKMMSLEERDNLPVDKKVPEKVNQTESEEILSKRNSMTGKRMSLEERADTIVENVESIKKTDTQDLEPRRTSLTAKRMSLEERQVIIKNEESAKQTEIEEIGSRRTSLTAKKMSLEERQVIIKNEEPAKQTEIENVGSRRTSITAKRMLVDESETVTVEKGKPQRIISVEDESSIKNGILSEEPDESNQSNRRKSVERRESFSKVEITNIPERRKLSTGFVINEINKGELFCDVQSIPNGEETEKERSKCFKDDIETGLTKTIDSPQTTGTPQTGRSENKVNDETGDSKTDELIKKIKKQRSILEEILDKEDERNIEAAPEILSSNISDRSVYESLSTVFEVEAHGVPRPEAKWFKENEELKIDEHTKISEQGEKYRLELRNIRLGDAALYKCKIINRLGEKMQSAQLSVMEEALLREPKFKTPLKPLIVPKGEDATFTAVLTADPVPEVKWTKDGQDVDARFTLSSSNKEVQDGLQECTFTLKIPAGRHEDTGDFKISATNKWGSADSSARLDMVFRPEIICFKDVTCVPYEQVELITNIIANPRPDITWMAGKKVIENSEHSEIVNDTTAEVYKLVLKNVGTDDEETYTVKALNNLGEASAKAKLTVHTEKPILLKQLESQTIKDYHPIEFKIRASGIPRPQITWYRDDQKLVSDERINIEDSTEGQACSTLAIAHFSPRDIGQYTVKAANLAGEAESSAMLRMAQIPPSFGKTLERSVDLAEGETLELKAKVDGSPLPAVKWLKDGEPLLEDDRVKITIAPDGSVKLTVDNVKPSDCGAFKLLAVNDNGESSSICAVAVSPEPRVPKFTKGLGDSVAVEGEPIKLEAIVEAHPPPEVKWTKDGHPLRPSPHVVLSNAPNGLVTLSVDKARPEDAGNYELTVSNRLGDATSCGKVDVSQKEKKPSFLAQLQPASVVEGFPAKMDIKVTGFPAPQVSWFLDGKPIVPDGKHIKIVDGPDGAQSLIIDSTTPEDAGVYSVTVNNPQGEIYSQAPLSVTARAKKDTPEEAPSFTKGLRDAAADEDSPLSFSAPFIGNPIPDVAWTKDGIPLESGDRVTMTCDGTKVGLEINPCRPGDAGTYTCRLTNPLGEAQEEAKGKVRKIYQKPEFIQKFNDLQQLPTYDAKMQGRVSGMPRPEVTWYKDGRPITESPKYRMRHDGDTVSLYVQDCAMTDSGIYRCVATNREGEDSCQAELEVVDKLERKPKAEPPLFLKKIGDCEVFKGMTAKFTACAMGSPEPEVEWFRGADKLFPSERIRIEREATGLLRLSIIGVDPTLDVGLYRCRIYNPHGEANCEAHMVYDSLDIRPRKPIGEQYIDYDKFQRTGAPLPLSDRPIISRMTDRRLTLSWKPSIPIGPRDPVTYQVEMCELPSGEWFTARTGVRSCACDIANLEPFRDYKFRIRVENKYGVSDPSPFAQTYRQKLEPDPPKFMPYLPPGIDFRPETSPYFPKDFDIERPPHDGYAEAPKFLRQEHDTQYGVKNHNCNLFWFVYGYPKPKMSFFFNDEPIEMGGRYDSSYTRNGQASLFINKMLERDVGLYEAVATNEHGIARQRVRLEIAEYPEFLQRPEETVVMVRRSGRLEARIVGVPYPDIKWYKDWQPLASSSRIKMLEHLINIFPESSEDVNDSSRGKIQHIEPDLCVLIINDAITKDEGLYSVSARNIAGSISSSVMLRVEESEADYGYLTYGRGRNVKPKTKLLGDFYDLGDELGRGTQGITYHAVERLTGRNYASKVMHGKHELRSWMRNELEMMNQLNHKKLIRLYDAYEGPHTFTLVTEIASGGELLYNLTKQTFVTESEIAGYIRQILWGLEHMHDQNIAHLGLTPGDLLIAHPGGDDLKICDFGLARRIAYGRLAPLDYGMPEFVAPEVVKGEGVSFPADMWSLGIITHLLLTGVSMFRGVDDRTTLTNIKEQKWQWREDLWANLSAEARDFVSKLLVYDAEGRMDVKAALRHPWLNLADRMPQNQYNITTDTLRNYYNLLKDWYGNASCRTWYRRMPLGGAYTHPSRMVYPPGREYTPDATPPPDRSRKSHTPRSWEDQIPSRQPLDYELGLIKSESHYQSGPDTYLLQLRDVDFPVRLREYMKVAAHRCPLSRDISDRDNSHVDWRTPVIRERRRFTDIMDEEIDDERRERINQYGSADTYTLRRLRHELGTRLDSHVEAEALLSARREGMAPFFREKPQTLPIEEDKPGELVCYAVGDPRPIVQWFKNDMVVTESHRVKILEDDLGRSILRFGPAHAMDMGIYKVTARNKSGQTVARCRVVLAETPHAPDSPEANDISDTEVLLKWKQPKADGNSAVVCYNLQYKEADAIEWINVASNIDHEFFVVRNLKPSTSYQFRLAARNRIGWSEKGIPTEPIKTLEAGTPKVTVSRAMRHLQDLVEGGQEVLLDESKSHLDYTTEKNPIHWSHEQPTAKYNYISEISRGRFSVVVKGIDKTSDRVVVAKLLEYRPDTESQVDAEFEAFRALRHERLASLIEAYKATNSSVAVLIQEKLQGVDVLTYLSSRHEYTEQIVANIITQILDGLQYLHWRGYCHLDLQPDNVVMASVRSIQVKLVDFGATQKVSKMGTIVKSLGHLEYTSPEVLSEEAAFPQSDIWSVGVLTYVLLSAVSPFRGESADETRQNINFVRFRFEHLYKELTQEATRFIMLVFKRHPGKRPTAEECHEHRWLLPTEYMIKRRDRAVFLGNRLKEFCEQYHAEKAKEITKFESLTSAIRSMGPNVTRSNSIQEEILATF